MYLWNNPSNICTVNTDHRCKQSFTLTEGNYAVADQKLLYSPCTTVYTTAGNLANAATGAAPGANCETVVTDTSLNQTTAFIYDVTLPTFEATAPAALTNNSSITFTVADTSLNGSANVALAPLNTATVTAADFAVTNGTVDSVTCTAATATCDVVVTATADGTVTLDKAAGYSVSDTATNAGTAFTAASLDYDGTAPAVSSFTTSESTPTKATSIAYALTFSESVTGLAAGDLSNAGTATSCSFGITGSGSSYTVTVTGCSTSGTLTPRLATAGVSDAAGNTGPAATADGSTLTLDRVAPAVSSFTTAVSSPTNASSIAFALDFTETVSGLASSDITNAGTATSCSYAIGGSGASYTVTVTGCSTTGTLDLRLAADGVTDAAGNTGPASIASAASILTLDRVAPAVISFTTAVSSPTNSTSIAFALDFTEGVDGLVAGDFSNAGTATGCSFTVMPNASIGIYWGTTTYTVTVTGCSTTGTLTPRLATNSVADAAGNSGPSEIDAPTLTLDRVAPGVSSFTPTTGSPTNAASLVYSLDFNESVTGLGAGDFTIGGTATGWSVASISGSGTSYTVTLGGGTDGTVILTLTLNTIADAAGNTGPADASVAASPSITVDTVAPTATVTTAVSSPTNSTSIAYAVSFSEDVTGLATGDFSNQGTATGCSFSLSGSGDSYTLTVTGCSTTGTLAPRLASAAVTDAAGNTGPAAAANGATLTLDRVAPAVSSFTTAVSSPTNSTSIAYTLVFSESVTGLTAGDFSNQGTATSCSFGISGSGTTYTVTVTGCSTSGTLTPRLASATVADAAGNTGPASSADGSTLTLDRGAPTAASFTTSASNPTNATTISYSLVFSESVTGLATGDFSNAGTATGCSFGVTGSGTSYTIAVTGCSTTGTLELTLASASVNDAAGNAGPAADAVASEITIDRTAITVDSFTTAVSSPTSAASVDYTLVFNKSVTGLASGDLSNQGTATGCSFSVSGSGDTYTITVTGCDTTGTLRPRLNGNSVGDAAGNTGPGSATYGTQVTLDAVAPTVSSFTFANLSTPVVGESLVFHLVFSEEVTGLVTGDFEITGSATGWSVSSLTGSGASYTVTLTGGSAGSVTLTLKANAVADAAGTTAPSQATSVTTTVLASSEVNDGGDTSGVVGEGSITLAGGDFDFGSAYPGEAVTAGADFSVTSNNDMGYEVTLVVSDLTKTGVRKNGDKVPASIVIIDTCPTVLFATTNNGNWEAEAVCPTSAFDAPRLIAQSGIRSRADGDVFTLALGFVIPWIEEGTYNGTATFTASSL
jgi:hypothetical protein